MITKKDMVEQFKRELKSYTFYQKKVQECNEQLEEIAVKLQGISSPSAKDTICENARNPYLDNKVHWLVEESNIILERSKYIQMIMDIDSKIALMSEEARQIAIKAFIEKQGHQKVADGLHMGRTTMYRTLDEELKKIF